MTQMSSPVRSAPEHAYRWMKGYIAGLPRDQEIFLNEASLATSTGTSRTPVREALLRLEAEGFIKRIPNKGAYVPAISDPEVHAILQARSVVEKWAASSVFGPTVIGRLRSLISEQEAAQDDPERFIELDTEFHSTIIRAGENPILVDFYTSLRQRQLRIGIKAVTVKPESDRARDVLREHERIVDALERGSADLAHAAIDAHLDSTLRAVIGR